MTRGLSLIVLLSLAGCTAPRGEQITLDRAMIDSVARALMQREHVQGLALAVIDGGDVAYVAAYGRRNVEQDLPLTTETVMYGASLTKTAFAYMLLQLVDEGQLDLDASLPDLLPHPLRSTTTTTTFRATTAGVR